MNSTVRILANAFSLILIGVSIAGADVKLESILPPDFKPEMVEEHFQNDRYGFIIDKRGCLRSLHNAQGQVLFTMLGEWIIQGTQATSSAEFTYDGGIPSGPEVKPQKSTDTAGNPTYLFKGEKIAKAMDWELLVRCLPGKLLMEYKFSLSDDLPNGPTSNIIVPFRVNNPDLEEGFNASPLNPFVFPFNSGKVTVEFDEKFKWFGNPGYNAGGHGITFYPNFDGTKSKGGRDTMKIEIRIPEPSARTFR